MPPKKPSPAQKSSPISNSIKSSPLTKPFNSSPLSKSSTPKKTPTSKKPAKSSPRTPSKIVKLRLRPKPLDPFASVSVKFPNYLHEYSLVRSTKYMPEDFPPIEPSEEKYTGNDKSKMLKLGSLVEVWQEKELLEGVAGGVAGKKKEGGVGELWEGYTTESVSEEEK